MVARKQPLRRRNWRDWLIGAVLVLATVQCVRADFLMSDTFVDWGKYAAGQAAMPYQGRVSMIPVLRAAERSETFRRFAQRYADSVTIGSQPIETITVEKVASMCAGVISLLAMMSAALWFSLRRKLQPWWLGNVLVLAIVTVTLVMRATQNYWYAYDLPHAAVFGCAALFALEGWWVPGMAAFALDVPTRETAVFLVPLLLVEMVLQSKKRRRAALLRASLVGSAMVLFWMFVRQMIARHFAANPNDVYPRLEQNLHELIMPHHWPQLFSAGGYLPIFIWLARRRLRKSDRALLYVALLCAPVTLYYGVWTETRVWLEWTLPLAVLGAVEASSAIADRTFAAAGSASESASA